MKRKFVAMALLLSSLAFATSHEESLPESWYRLPEDFPNAARLSEREERAKEEKAAKGVERILQASSKALDQVWEEQERRQMSREDWKFAALALDLSLSASGMIGVMMAKGEVSASLYWRPKKDEQSRYFPEDDKVDLKIRGDWSRKEVARQLEPIIKAVMATKEVKDEPKFRKNLLETVVSYQHLLQGMAFNPGREWGVSRLRLDVGVDFSGTVAPAITAGVGVRLRFEWEPSSDVRAIARVRDTKETENLRRFVTTIGKGLETIPLETLTPEGFDLKQLKFGLGIFGDGKFGVVKVGASVMGHLYLSPRKVTHPVFIPEDEMDQTIALIDEDAQDRHLEYARATQVRYTVATGRDGRKKAVYDIPREAFRKGLERAAKMGGWMAERASRSNGSNWEFYQVKTEFALSLSGSVGIINLGGTAALELNFQKVSKATTL